MKRRTRLALFAALVAAVSVSSAALAAGTGSAVSLQIKTQSKNLFGPKKVHGERGWIRKGGMPAGVCSGTSGAGALDAATHGRWTATYYPSLHDVFITSIFGVKAKKPTFWGVFVNGKPASSGVCGVHLRRGEKLLLKITK
jgi:hypothetical protein